MPKGRPSRTQSESFEGRDTAIAFKAKYFPTLQGFSPVPSLFPGHFGIALGNANVYFRETPIAHNLVAGIVGADPSFKTITATVFSLKLEDETPMLQLALRWGDAYYSAWSPYTDSNCNRMKQLASELMMAVTENVLAFNHISKLNVKVLLARISGRMPHATIVPAGQMTDELFEFAGDLNQVHKEIDKFIRPGLSLIGEVPPLKSKERLAQDAEEARLFNEKYTLEERRAIIDQRLEEQARRGGDLTFRNLLGATQDELLAMPPEERDAFIANHQKQAAEKKAKVREEVEKIRQEMLSEQETAPAKPVEVKKPQKTKNKTKSRKTQKQKDTD